MTAWIMVVRGLDTDDEGARDAERRIKAALPEHNIRAVTVLEWLYDAQHKPGLKPPPLVRVVHVAEHTAPVSLSGKLRRKTGAQ